MTPRRILLAGWLVFIVYAYPGYLLPDGRDQLFESRTLEFSDLHAPVMTELWRITGIALSGPAGMLIAQSVLLLLASYFVLRDHMSARAAAIAAACMCVFPPLIAALAIVTAEALLVGVLLAAVVAFSHKRWWGGLALLVLACDLRAAAVFATLPIVVALFRWRDQAPRWQRVAIVIAAWLSPLLAASVADRLLVDVRTHHDEVAFAMTDIVGTLRYAGDRTDDQLSPLLDGVALAYPTEIQQRARNVYGRELFYAATDVRVFEPPTSDAERDALAAARNAIIRAEPVAYLRHRWHLFYRELGFPRTPTWSPAYTEFVPVYPRDSYSLAHASRHSLMQETLIRPVSWFAQTFWFRPYFYLVIAIVLLPLAVRRRLRVAGVLLASGVLFELSLMFATWRVEYQDSLWMIATTVLAIIMLVAQRLKARHERVGDQAAVAVAADDHVEALDQRA